MISYTISINIFLFLSWFSNVFMCLSNSQGPEGTASPDRPCPPPRAPCACPQPSTPCQPSRAPPTLPTAQGPMSAPQGSLRLPMAQNNITWYVPSQIKQRSQIQHNKLRGNDLKHAGKGRQPHERQTSKRDSMTWMPGVLWKVQAILQVLVKLES